MTPINYSLVIVPTLEEGYTLTPIDIQTVWIDGFSAKVFSRSSTYFPMSVQGTDTGFLLPGHMLPIPFKVQNTVLLTNLAEAVETLQNSVFFQENTADSPLIQQIFLSQEERLTWLTEQGLSLE